MAKVRRFKPQRTPKPVPVPAKFVPNFWVNQDHRCHAVKEVRRRVAALIEDAAVESVQKELLAQRAAFIGLRLETMEVTAARTGEFDPGVYAQLTNTFIGLLKALGLEKQVKRVVTLKTYVGGKS